MSAKVQEVQNNHESVASGVLIYTKDSLQKDQKMACRLDSRTGSDQMTLEARRLDLSADMTDCGNNPRL